jgi:hypothetical protein
MLISRTDILKYRDISQSVGEKVINQHIKDAELIDLAPLIGDVLYNDIVTTPTETANGSYPDLLNGSVYTYSTLNYRHPGLKQVLADFAYARYRFFGSDVDTAFSTVIKKSRDSEATSENRNREVYSAIRKVAFAKWEIVRDYLNRRATEAQGTAYEYWYNHRPPLDNDEDQININKITIG